MLSTIDAIKKFNWPLYKSRVCELTISYKCNLNCVFCYSSPQLDWNNIDDIQFKDAVNYIIDSYKRGSRIIQIIGGEPTVYDKLDKLIKIAKKIGYPIIQIVTNGQKLKDYLYFKKLVGCGLNSVTFSLHSSNPSIHDKIVGILNSFKNITKAIENSLKLGIYPTIGTAVTKINYKDTLNLTKFSYENFKIETYHFIALHSLGMAKKSKLNVRYTQIIPYIKETMDYLKEKNVFPISPILSNFQPCNLPGFEHLISDWKIPFFDDDLYLPETVYKESMYTMITQKLRMKSKKCKKCIYYKICAGFEKEYFNVYGDDEFIPLNGISKPFPINTFYKN